jgi:hypothetical protein
MFTLEGAIVNEAGVTVTRPSCTTNIPIFCESSCSVAPAVDFLGSLSNFAIFATNGIAANASTTGVIGNVGSDVGGITGFASSIIIGDFHIADAVTDTARVHLDKAYDSLMAMPNTVPSDLGVFPVVPLPHSATFGSVAFGGETINAGVYLIHNCLVFYRSPILQTSQ